MRDKANIRDLSLTFGLLFLYMIMLVFLHRKVFVTPIIKKKGSLSNCAVTIYTENQVINTTSCDAIFASNIITFNLHNGGVFNSDSKSTAHSEIISSYTIKWKKIDKIIIRNLVPLE